MSHILFGFLKPIFSGFGLKTICHRARQGYNRNFLSNLFDILKQFRPKNQRFKNRKMSHRGEGGEGGSEKCQKIVTYYLNGPLLS
jgi:hypothetical protein